MAENKMKEVAELLGVEFNKSFNIEEYGNQFYRINEKGLEKETRIICKNMLVKLLLGELHVKQPILDDVEKRYLEGVLRPFKDRVICIRKGQVNDLEYINIFLKFFTGTGDDGLPFPYFEPNSMYKGMELGKKYTLEELGLFQD